MSSRTPRGILESCHRSCAVSNIYNNGSYIRSNECNSTGSLRHNRVYCHILRQLVLEAVGLVVWLVLGEFLVVLLPVPRLRSHTLPKYLAYNLGRQRSAGAYTWQRTLLY